MVRNAIASVLALFVYLVVSATVFAAGDVVCQPIYGGGQTCVQVGDVMIDKKVLNPQTNAYVDNLGVNDPKHGPEFTTTFQITLTNTGKENSRKITVKDIFPQFVTFVQGPGKFDQNSKTLTFEQDNLNANEAKTFTILGKVVSANQLPQDQGVTCVVNQASVTARGKTSQDNSQFCIQRDITTAPSQLGVAITPGVTKGGLQVFPQPQVTTTPPTGPEMLSLLALLPTGAIGILLRRKAQS